ncbi:1-phosphofructokinase [Vibrio campbellii]
MMPKVVTVTLNPAFDLTGSVASLNVGSVNLVDGDSLSPAGKGINVAKVLSDLGGEVLVTGFLGRDNSAQFKQFFKANRLDNHFVDVAGSTRTNIKIVDEKGAVTDLNFAGFEVTEQDITKLESTILSLAEQAEYFVFAGSLPKGLPANKVVAWIDLLQQQDKKVILDSSKEMLKLGVAVKPWMIKPNEHELAELFQLQTLPVTRDALIQRCRELGDKLVADGITNVMVSLGADGLLWIDSQQTLFAEPLSVKVASTVGAGDSVVAAFCWASVIGMPKSDSLQFCTAMGAHAVSQVNVGVSSLSLITEKQAQVKLHVLN